MFGAGILGKMFGSEKALGNIVGSVSRGLDSLVYTQQEKEQAADITHFPLVQNEPDR